jgi:hypothetical protein
MTSGKRLLPDLFYQEGVDQLPVVVPSKFPLVIDIKAAKALGLEVPDSPLAPANEVIK